MKTNILNINFDVIQIDDATQKLINAIENNEKCFVVTPNPEIVMIAQKDLELKKIINSADLVIADGIGIVLASKFNKIKIKNRVAGYDLVQKFFSMSKNYKIYFLGSSTQIIELAKKNMQEKFKNINIVGAHNGFFDNNEEIINQINLLNPDVLLVGMGAPKQEKWIYKYKDKLNAKVFIGIGGSFDVMSGKIKRAPTIFQKLGLEWFYRLIKQPKRFWRMLALPKFLAAVLLKKFS
jgi:bacterial polymer biosynthesis proteins, WecB/TagA/CpsF family